LSSSSSLSANGSVSGKSPHCTCCGLTIDPYFALQVKKYEMSDEDYAKRTNTYRAFKEQQRQQNPNWKSIYEKKNQKNNNTTDTEEVTESNTQVQERIKVGLRCSIQPGGRRGTVKYVGPVPELTPGVNQSGEFPLWIGVEFDEPVGKHDGSIHGHSYFTCKAKYGSIVKPQHVQCGDFPETDPFADSDEEEDKDTKKEDGNNTAQQGPADLYEEL